MPRLGLQPPGGRRPVVVAGAAGLPESSSNKGAGVAEPAISVDAPASSSASAPSVAAVPATTSALVASSSSPSPLSAGLVAEPAAAAVAVVAAAPPAAVVAPALSDLPRKVRTWKPLKPEIKPLRPELFGADLDGKYKAPAVADGKSGTGSSAVVPALESPASAAAEYSPAATVTTASVAIEEIKVSSSVASAAGSSLESPRSSPTGSPSSSPSVSSTANAAATGTAPVFPEWALRKGTTSDTEPSRDDIVAELNDIKAELDAPSPVTTAVTAAKTAVAADDTGLADIDEDDDEDGFFNPLAAAEDGFASPLRLGSPAGGVGKPDGDDPERSPGLDTPVQADLTDTELLALEELLDGADDDMVGDDVASELPEVDIVVVGEVTAADGAAGVEESGSINGEPFDGSLTEALEELDRLAAEVAEEEAFEDERERKKHGKKERKKKKKKSKKEKKEKKRKNKKKWPLSEDGGDEDRDGDKASFPRPTLPYKESLPSSSELNASYISSGIEGDASALNATTTTAFSSLARNALSRGGAALGLGPGLVGAAAAAVLVSAAVLLLLLLCAFVLRAACRAAARRRHGSKKPQAGRAQQLPSRRPPQPSASSLRPSWFRPGRGAGYAKTLADDPDAAMAAGLVRADPERAPNVPAEYDNEEFDGDDLSGFDSDGLDDDDDDDTVGGGSQAGGAAERRGHHVGTGAVSTRRAREPAPMDDKIYDELDREDLFVYRQEH
ncbi:hypothetical protein HK405_002578 [Cladochytrium tenue]|nr:hypothetical protein HK405_002578 [Cladochytrium tenue]